MLIHRAAEALGIKTMSGPDTQLIGVNTLPWGRTSLVRLPKEAGKYVSQKSTDENEGGYTFVTSKGPGLAWVQEISPASPRVSGKSYRRGWGVNKRLIWSDSSHGDF